MPNSESSEVSTLYWNRDQNWKPGTLPQPKNLPPETGWDPIAYKGDLKIQEWNTLRKLNTGLGLFLSDWAPQDLNSETLHNENC